jgi:hypothetical protein
MKPLDIQETCPDCEVTIGELHQPGCDVERCSFCGKPLSADDACCSTYARGSAATSEPHRLPWDGVWPGVRECREYGLWCKWTQSSGWQHCHADDPDATEDLNELLRRAQWNPHKKCWRIP